MSRVHLAALTLPALCLGLASSAIAKLPDPASCEVPDHVVLVARQADGTADPFGTFSILIRNLAGNPQPNTYVLLDFTACPDLRICSDQGDPNVSVDCSYRSVRAFTGMDGRVTFTIIGSAINSGGSPGATGPNVNVYADGVFLKTIRVAAIDEDGAGGVDGADLSLFLADYFSGQTFARSDFDGDGVLSGNDLSVWHGVFFGGTSVRSGTPSCP